MTTPSASPPIADTLNIAVVGCTHGELDAIYTTIAHIEHTKSAQLGRPYTIDLVLCAGDFQSCRNTTDLHSMSVPPKYAQLHTFHQYYTAAATKRATRLTLFTGGNHESSNYLMELWAGGYVAPNIYYTGYSNLLYYAGYSIAALSGIYKPHDYRRGYTEAMPFDDRSKRSVYHVRQHQVDKLQLLTVPMTHPTTPPPPSPPHIHLFVSHDWPVNIPQYGDTARLLRQKPYFREEVERRALGSVPGWQLLTALKPDYWFAAHLHVKFAAVVRHDVVGAPHHQPSNGNTNGGGKSAGRTTKFLALDKCKPNAEWLQIIELPAIPGAAKQLCHSVHWLGVLRATLPYMSMTDRHTDLPRTLNVDADVQHVRRRLAELQYNVTGDMCAVQQQFVQTGAAHGEQVHGGGGSQPLTYVPNPQTKALLDIVEREDPYLTRQQQRYRSTNNVIVQPPIVQPQPQTHVPSQQQTDVPIQNDEEIELDNV